VVLVDPSPPNRTTPTRSKTKPKHSSANASELTVGERWRIIEPLLIKQGWKTIAGTGLVSWVYLRPGATKSTGKLGTDYYHAWQDALSAVETDTGYMRSENGQTLKAALKAAALDKEKGLSNTKGDDSKENDKEDDDDKENDKDKEDDDDEENDKDKEDDEEDDEEDDKEDDDDEDDDKGPISVNNVRTIADLRTLAKHNLPLPAIDEHHKYHSVCSDGKTTLGQIARVHECEPPLLTLLNRCKSSCIVFPCLWPYVR
jgi:hypothetical protein